MQADRPLTCRECCYLTFGTVLVASLAAVAIFSDWPWKASPWAVLTAIGTVSATIAAVWMAYRESRRQADQSYAVASLHAASIAALIEDEIIQPVNSAVARIHFAINPLPGAEAGSAEKTNAGIRSLARKLDEATKIISPDNLALLIGLRQNVAHRAAYGLAGLERISRQLNRSIRRGDLSNDKLIVINPLDYCKGTHDALKYLSAAMLECQSASYSSAPAPSAEEAYGAAND